MSGSVQPANQLLPQDLQSIVDALDRTDQEARLLVAELSEEQLHWHPAAGAWSVGQCLSHLGQMNAVLIGAMQSGVREAGTGSIGPRRPIQPGWLARWFIQEMDAPPRRRMRTPKQGIPSPQSSGKELLAAFLAAHDELRSLIHEARDLDLNRIRFRNPFIGWLRYSVGTGMMVIGAHDRRHLWQANQVCAAMKPLARE